MTVYQQDVNALRAAGFDTVLLDAEAWQRTRGDAQVLRDALGEPLWEGESGTIWALPTTGAPGTPPKSPWRLPEP